MSILCKVELSEVRGKLRGLKITHPDMGLVMDWGARLPTANVRLVPQEMAFQMMADIERMKTYRLERELFGDNVPAQSRTRVLHGFLSMLDA